MNNRRRVLGTLGALVLAVVGTVALVGYVQAAKDEAVADEALVEVYVVDELVPKGADSEAIVSAVSLEQVPARLKQDGAITDLQAVEGSVAATDLQPGDQLLAARLVAPEAVALEITDKVQISVKLAVERAVGGSLQQGDLVGVYLSFDPFELSSDGEVSRPSGADAPASDSSEDSTTGAPEKSPNMTRLEFQHVLVTDVQTTSTPVVIDESGADAVEQVAGLEYVVTLALSPEQSERFVFATEFGHVWLSKDPASVSDDGTRLVTLGNVYAVER